MAHPSTKKPKQQDSAGGRNEDENSVSPIPHKSSHDSRDGKKKSTHRDRTGETTERRRDDDRRDERRRRSRSRDRHHSRRERSRSRERGGRDRDRVKEDRRDRDRDRARDRDHRSRRERDWSPDRVKSSRDTRDEKDRDRDRRRHHSRSRTRSRSPARNGTVTATRTRSPPKAPRSSRRKDSPSSKVKIEKTDPEDIMQVDSKPNGQAPGDEALNGEDAQMKMTMGFSTFKTTQNKKIPGNNVYGIRKEKSTQYRQYMNRTGGFNRPLSPSRDL